MKRYNSLSILNALEYNIVFQGHRRISIRNVLAGVSRDSAARLAGLLTRLYCNHNAKNVIYMLSASDKRRRGLLNRVEYLEEQYAKKGVGLVVAFDIAPLELLRIALSMNPESMQDTPKELADKIQFDLVKAVMQVNEDLMNYKIDKKKELNVAELVMVNSASYNDVLKESDDPYLYQSAQSFLFFKWLESVPKYQEILQAFYDHFGIQSWKEYVRTVYGLALLSYKEDAGVLPKTIKTDPPGMLSYSIIEKLSIDVNKETIPYSSKDEFDREGNSDFRHFKSRPLLRLSNGDYVVHNPRLLIDRLYSSLYFDFMEIADNMSGKHIDISGLFTESFVEKTMFSSYLKECLTSGFYEALDEKQLKSIYKIRDGEPGYPDYYLRSKESNSVLLFECKDIRLNSWVKDQRDYALLEAELKNKIVEKTYQLDQEKHCRKPITPKRIGVGQIAAHVVNIRRGTFPWGKELPINCNIYPVLVIADNRLIFDGLPYLAQQWLEERLKVEGGEPHSCHPLIMMSPLTLLKYCPLFKEKGFEYYFEAYYSSLYESVVGNEVVDTLNRMISFDTYMEQYKFSLEKLRVEITDSLFSKEEIDALIAKAKTHSTCLMSSPLENH